MKETLNSYLKLEKRKLNNKLIKGVCTILSFLFFSLCIPPFQIYATTESQIVPTWPSSASQYSTHISVTNYCDGSGTSTSCELRFVADQPYYGYIAFDGYSGNTLWLNFQYVYMSDGYGAYRYSLYNNGVIQINRVDVALVSLHMPDSNVDLTAIEQLLTIIETNTRKREYSFPFESYSAMNTVTGLYPSKVVEYFTDSTYIYPVFRLDNGDILMKSGGLAQGIVYTAIFIVYGNPSSIPTLQNYVSITNGTFSNLNFLFRLLSPDCCLIKINCIASGGIMQINSLGTYKFIPIYFEQSTNKNVSTEFALKYGLSNQLIDDVHAIAQGTTESNSAATGLDSETSTFESVASGLYQSENSFNQNMNSSLQSIDTSFNPSTSFGSKFLYSADWVRSQFNTLTSQTPFGSVLSFSMLLGLSLLIIGKVFK